MNDMCQHVYTSVLNNTVVNGFYMLKCRYCGNVKAHTRAELNEIQARKSDIPDFLKNLFGG